MSYRLLPLALLLVAVGCNRPGTEFEISAALAEVRQKPDGGFPPVVDDQFGGRFGFGFTTPVATSAEHGSGFRLGGRLSASFFREELDTRDIAGEPLLEVEDFANLTLLSPQFTASWRQVFGDQRHGATFFVEPGVGVGPTVGIHSFGADLQFANRTLSTDTFDTKGRVSWSVNPFLRIGAAMDGLLIGVEGGYEWTGLEFHDYLGRDASVWYVGLMLSVDVGG